MVDKIKADERTIQSLIEIMYPIRDTDGDGNIERFHHLRECFIDDVYDYIDGMTNRTQLAESLSKWLSVYYGTILVVLKNVPIK